MLGKRHKVKHLGTEQGRKILFSEMLLKYSVTRFGIKKSPNLSKTCPKSSQISFYLKSNVFWKSSKSRQIFGLITMLKWANNGLFLFISGLFKLKFYWINCRLQWDLISYCWSRRQAPWPLSRRPLFHKCYPLLKFNTFQSPISGNV